MDGGANACMQSPWRHAPDLEPCRPACRRMDARIGRRAETDGAAKSGPRAVV